MLFNSHSSIIKYMIAEWLTFVYFQPPTHGVPFFSLKHILLWRLLILILVVF